MENTTENQEQTFNHNEVNNRYEKNLEILKKRIKNIENKDISENNKKEDLINEFFNFILNILPENKELAHLIDIISETIKNNSKFAYKIINSCTQSFIVKGKNLENINTDISKIIQTDGIKDNPNLVFDIINGFIKGCLMQKPDNIKDITESFFNLFNSNFGEKEKEIKDKLKPVFSLIVSQYFINILTNSSNKQLSEEDKKQTETQLFECYKELFHVENKQEFQNISLKELLDLQDKYLKKDLRKKVSIMVENTKLS